MHGNILIICDDSDKIKYLKEIINLKRFNDRPEFCSFKDAKKKLTATNYKIVIIEELQNISRYVALALNSGGEVFVLCDEIKRCENEVYGYIQNDITKEELEHRLINCFKYINLKTQIGLQNIHLSNAGLINGKTEIYSVKYLKEIFDDIEHANNRLMCLITLDDSVKTKVSSNRLAKIIKKSIRKTDLLAQSKNDVFYLILDNISSDEVCELIQNIQDNMGEELLIHSGISKIGFQSFEDVEKIVSDSLQKAIKNNTLCASIGEDIEKDSWLDLEIAPQKEFKLFRNVYEKKIKSVIEPAFYRFKTDCASKFKVVLYANAAESSFSFKREKGNSELSVVYDGKAGVIVKISHSGLDTPENSEFNIPLNKFSESELIKLLKRLKQEYLQSGV